MSDPDTGKHARYRFQPPGFQSLSIRDELEKLAWLQNPHMANRLAHRQLRHSSEKRGRQRNTNRTMRWQDRSLLTLAAVLLTLFVIRTESAVADEQQWGLQLTNDADQFTPLAISTDIRIDITGLIARVEVMQKFSNHSSQWGRIQIPALTDICVDWGEAAEYYPEIIPDLYAGEPLWLIARLPAEPTIIGLCGQFNGQPWELDINGWDAASGHSDIDNLAGYPNTATGWLSQLLSSFFVLLLSSSLLWFSGSRLPMVKYWG